MRLKRTDLPPQNLESVYNRMKSERSKIAQDYLSQGDEQAAIIRARTDKEATLIVSEAARQAAEIEAEGELEAGAHLQRGLRRRPGVLLLLPHPGVLQDDPERQADDRDPHRFAVRPAAMGE